MPDADLEPSTAARVRKFDRPAPPRDWRWWVSGIGRTLIAIGLLLFGFVAYQLWGTGIETARAQNSLENEFEDLLATSAPVTTGPVATTPDATDPEVPDESLPPASVPAEPPVQTFGPIEEGDPIARLEIPSIGVENIVVAGVSTSDLKKGPGHFPETPLPGQLGNSAIAGHRTTYGQPFFAIDQVVDGDEIIVTTLAGRFVYRVTGQQIVTPSDYQVVATTDATRATLTLTSCHPKWTARERIIVTAELDVEASSAPAGQPMLNYGRPLAGDEAATTDTTTAPPTVPTTVPASVPASAPTDTAVVTTDPQPDPTTAPDGAGQDGGGDEAAIDAGIADAFADGWFSDPGANGQVALWGLLLAAVGILSTLISRRVKRDWVGLLVGIVPFMVTLYFFFQNVNRLLPPNL